MIYSLSLQAQGVVTHQPQDRDRFMNDLIFAGIHGQPRPKLNLTFKSNKNNLVRGLEYLTKNNVSWQVVQSSNTVKVNDQQLIQLNCSQAGLPTPHNTLIQSMLEFAETLDGNIFNIPNSTDC